MPTEVETVRALVDDELTRFLGEVRLTVPEAQPLVGAIGELIVAGGKRLRPLFCYWGYRIAGDHCDEIVRASAALELLHTFALIHDDIMDRSRLRRGRPTLHAERGTDFAILAGDLALVLADRAFFGAGFRPQVAMAAFEPYSMMRQEVIAGQLLDMQAGPDLTEDGARRIAVLKSGRYSVEMPLVIGATLAGAPSDLVGEVDALGAPLGEAFQLRDDLLGTFGTEAATGKPVDSDIREGKRNFLYAATAARLGGDERAFFAQRWGAGDDLDEADVARLRGLVGSSGARAATEELLEGLRADALARLGVLSIAGEVRAALEQLVSSATERST